VGAAWSSGPRHQSVFTLFGRSWVQISAPPQNQTNNGTTNYNGGPNNNGEAEARSRRLKKEKQTIEKGNRRLTVRRKKKFEPTISKCCNCMFCTTLRKN
jgi:hypothetical protein